jgi:hypothetical protein
MFMEQRETLQQRMGRRLVWVLFRSDFDFSELLCGLAGALWGAFLLLPQDTFASTPTFNSMELLAPEWAWGLAIMSGGLWQLASMSMEHHRSRRISALGGALTWAFISVLFALANIASTAVIIYPLLCLSATWAYWRLGRSDA